MGAHLQVQRTGTTLSCMGSLVRGSHPTPNAQACGTRPPHSVWTGQFGPAWPCPGLVFPSLHLLLPVLRPRISPFLMVLSVWMGGVGDKRLQLQEGWGLRALGAASPGCPGILPAVARRHLLPGGSSPTPRLLPAAPGIHQGVPAPRAQPPAPSQTLISKVPVLCQRTFQFLNGLSLLVVGNGDRSSTSTPQREKWGSKPLAPPELPSADGKGKLTNCLSQ